MCLSGERHRLLRALCTVRMEVDRGEDTDTVSNKSPDLAVFSATCLFALRHAVHAMAFFIEMGVLR